MDHKNIPTKPSSGLLGDIKAYTSNPLPFLKRNENDFGDIYKFRLAHRHLIVINNADYIHHLLKTNQKNYIKSLAYRKLRKLLGNGLFTNEGQSWLSQRRLAQPAFHKESLNYYVKLIRSTTQTHLTKYQKGDQISINQFSTELTLDIISRTLFGQTESGHELIHENLPEALEFMIKRITTSIAQPLWVPSSKNKKFKNQVKQLYSHIEVIINNKRQEKVKDRSLLQQFIDAVDEETGASMSNQQLKDEIMTFYLAGHETTAIAFSWLTYYLDTNPDELSACKKEAETLTDDYTFEALHSLKTIESCIHETLRMCSPVWVLGREALADDQLGPYKIKKGDSVIFSPFIIHRQERYFENPNQFKSSRFRDPVHHPNAYLPFGAGPRQCIGNHFSIMELKIILIEFFRNGGFTLVSKEFPEYEHLLTLRPKKTIMAQLL